MSFRNNKQLTVKLIFCTVLSLITFYADAQDSSVSYIRMSGFASKKKFQIAYSTADNTDHPKISSYRVKKHKRKRFVVVEGKTVFLDYNIAPKYESDMLQFFKDNFKDPGVLGKAAPFVHLAFIIDAQGNIISQGFNRNVNMDLYQKQFFELTKQINGKFTPAEVQGKKVACLYSFYFDYRKVIN